MEPQSACLRVMTYNICCPIDLESKPEQFAWSKRFQQIQTVIFTEKPDVICFQEIRGIALIDLSYCLTIHGYDIQTFRSSPLETSFVAMIAYKINRLAFDSFERWWASNTPNRCSDSWGNGFPRVTLLAKFYPIVKKGNKCFPNTKRDPIYIGNVHNGISHEEKVNSNIASVQKIESIVKKGHVLICGDFNSFSDDNGKDELNIFTDAKYCDLSSNLKTNEGIEMPGTFVGYSYDRYRIRGKCGPHVDHIFYRHFPDTKPCQFDCHVNARKYNGKDVENPKAATDYLKNSDEMPSDHFPVIVDISLGME